MNKINRVSGNDLAKMIEGAQPKIGSMGRVKIQIGDQSLTRSQLEKSILGLFKSNNYKDEDVVNLGIALKKFDYQVEDAMPVQSVAKRIGFKVRTFLRNLSPKRSSWQSERMNEIDKGLFQALKETVLNAGKNNKERVYAFKHILENLGDDPEQIAFCRNAVEKGIENIVPKDSASKNAFLEKLHALYRKRESPERWERLMEAFNGTFKVDQKGLKRGSHYFNELLSEVWFSKSSRRDKDADFYPIDLLQDVKEAALAGYPPAIQVMEKFLFREKEIPQIWVKEYEASKELDHGESYRELALYHQGHHPKLSSVYMEKAAENGDPAALYKKAIGLLENEPSVAHKLLQEAARKGFLLAKCKLTALRNSQL